METGTGPCTHRLFRCSRMEMLVSQTLQHLPADQSWSCHPLWGLAGLPNLDWKRCTPAQPRPSQNLAHRPMLAQLWHSYAEMRKPRSCTLQAIFNSWLHSARIQQLKKRLSANCRRVKVQRLEKAIHQAEDAARRRDSRALFAVIRRLTPKQPYRAIRLRGPGGEALTAAAECHQFETHFASVFQAQANPLPPNAGSLDSMPFSQEDLEYALAHAPTAKAVGPLSMPNVLLRILSEPLAAWLWPALQTAWCACENPEVPTTWKDAWLVLLAKRLVRTPRDVRPIALTDSLGKTVLGLLTQILSAQVYPIVCHQPLFAYLPQRGTLEALQFVCAHCRHVRSACESNSQSYWKRLQGTPTRLAGGLILSLDMSQAFDRLPRDTLEAGLNELQVDPKLSQLFLKWLHQATYHFQHRRTPCSVPTSQGVRQGCKASPIEWTIFLTMLLRRLDAALTTPQRLSWIKEHLITYADDLLAMWTLHTHQDVSNAIRQIGVILDILADLGMQVNFNKSVLLMRLSGRSFQTLKEKLIQKRPGGWGILIPRATGTNTFLPLVDQHVYLGIQISFYNFEDQTLRYRLKIGRTAFLRLRPWLLQRHAFPLKLRIRLWQTCIQTACLYGLYATGLTAAGALKLHRHLACDIRRIARSPSFVTHEPTVDLCQRLSLSMPLQHVQELWTQCHERQCSRGTGLAPNDFVALFDYQAHHQYVMQVFQHTDNPTFVDILLCPYCDFSTQQPTNLTTHLRKIHHTATDVNQFIPLRDAAAGHPQCTHCSRRLATRGGLLRHICHYPCIHFDEHQPWQAALADDPELRRMANLHDWSSLWTNHTLLEQIRRQCVLCGLQYATRKSMVTHLHRDHGQAWALTQPKVTTLAASTTTNPCVACGHAGKRAHACSVLRQLAIIEELTQQDLTVAAFVSLPTQETPTLASPHKRARQSEATTSLSPGATFQPARDALAGGSTCAHCNTTVKTMYILRRHIEDGYCKQFSAGRSIGNHVPCTWTWLLKRAAADPLALLADEEVKQTLCTTCTLCGQRLQRSGAILPHLHNDHANVLQQAQTCAICDETCGIYELGPHLEAHDAVIQTLHTYLPLAQSLFMDCCASCLEAQALPPYCPVALNLCAMDHDLSLTLTEDDMMGELHESWGHLLNPPNAKRQRPNQPKAAGEPQAHLSAVSKALIQLALRHESQLQALAMDDQFILFFQSDQRGILPLLLKATESWKDLQQKKQLAQPLRCHLFQAMTQELLTRLEKVLKAKPQDELWKGLLTTNVLTDSGAWNYMTYCPQQKKMIPMDKKPLAMERMKEWVTELHELGQNPVQILRFKSLKRQTTHPNAAAISPWLLQITGRHQRLWELLTSLSHSGLWLLLYSRLRAHQSRSNPLAETLVQHLRGPSGKQLPKPAWPCASSTMAIGATRMPMWVLSFGVCCNALLPAGLTLSMGKRPSQPSLPRANLGLWSLPRLVLMACSEHGAHIKGKKMHTNSPVCWLSDCLDVTWSRRLHVNDRICTYDHGSACLPPTLTIGAHEKGSCSLQQLTDMWHEHSGMKTCFHRATDLIGLHLDRLTRNASGDPCRADWTVELDPCVLLPFWNDEDSMTLHHREYIPVAVVYHSGTMHSGHLRAAVLTSAGWYHTEDNRVALPDPTDLETILKEITFIWLSEDALQLQTIPGQVIGLDDWVTKAVWYIFHRKYAQLKTDDCLLQIMRQYCAACGVPFFGATCLYEHVKHHREGFWPCLRQEYLRLMPALNCSQIPCDLCLASFHPRGPWDYTDRDHACPTVMNLCVAAMYYGSSLAPVGTRYNMPAANDMGMLRNPPLLPPLAAQPADPVGAFLDALLR